MAVQVTDRVLILRLDRKLYYDQRVEQYITYNGSRLTLTNVEIEDLLSKIPSIWNSDKDRLTYFVLFADK